MCACLFINGGTKHILKYILFRWIESIVLRKNKKGTWLCSSVTSQSLSKIIFLIIWNLFLMKNVEIDFMEASTEMNFKQFWSL